MATHPVDPQRAFPGIGGRYDYPAPEQVTEPPPGSGPAYQRDHKGRFAKMGTSVENIDNVSGSWSPNTIERPRHAPEADGTGPGPVLPHRHPVLASEADTTAARYGNTQGALGRAAALAGHGRPEDPTLALVDPYGLHLGARHMGDA